MNTEARPNASTHARKTWRRFVLPVVVLLAALAGAVLLYSATRAVSVSGRGEALVLEPGQIRMGILKIDEGASVSLRQGSHWIGPILSKDGSLTVDREATITGPVVMFSNGLRLGEKATVRGSVVVFSGPLTLDRGASVRGNVVLFAGPLTLGPEASVRRNAVLFAGPALLAREASIGGETILFAGPAQLQEKALLRGDAILFAGPLQLGSEAAAFGKVVAFAGSMDLGPRSAVHNGAVLFSADTHLLPGAQVVHDLVLVEGNATLDRGSKIAGTLYLTPEAISQRGRLIAADEAVITGGVVRPDDIESTAARNLEGWLLLRLVRLAAPPLIGLGMLIVLVVFLVWRGRSHRAQPGAGARLAEMNLQPTTPGGG